jgi:hypothetical protein
VDGEWSFIQTLRHLVFATDAWIRRAMLGEPRPGDSLDLPFTTFRKLTGIPNDPDVRPSLDEVLALREDRMETVRRVLDGLTQEQLESQTEAVTEPGCPEPAATPPWLLGEHPVRGVAPPTVRRARPRVPGGTRLRHRRRRNARGQGQVALTLS